MLQGFPINVGVCSLIYCKCFRVDNAFLVSLVGLRPEKYFWIGLSNQRHIDSFVWTNTDTVRFTHWNVGMPGMKQRIILFIKYIKVWLCNEHI